MKTIFIKAKFTVCLVFFALQITFSQNVGIGTTNPDASAILELNSTDMGMLIPRMSTTNRINIIGPAKGLFVYDNDTNTFWFYSGTAWIELKSDNLGDHLATEDLDMGDYHINNIGDLDVGGIIKDKDGDAGNAGQVLCSTLTGTDWVDAGGNDNLGNHIATLDLNLANHNINSVNDIHVQYKFKDGNGDNGTAGQILSSTFWGTDWINPIREIDDLDDGKTAGNSLFLGSISGQDDNGNNNYNTGVGESVLKDNVAGRFNTGVGSYTFWKLNGGENNTAVGSGALYENISGSGNTVIGNGAGHEATGSYNLFIGHQSGYNESGNDKLYIENSSSSTPLIWGDFNSDDIKINGHFQVTQTFKDKDGDVGTSGQILSSNASGQLDWVNSPSTGATEINELTDGKTGGNSLFLGNNAGQNDNGGSTENIGIGYQSLLNNTSGYYNVSIGNHSMFHNSTGAGNIAIGRYSLFNNKINVGSIAIGHGAMENANNNITGSYSTYNTAIGINALKGGNTPSNNTGRSNTSIGYESMFSNTQGGKNTGIGESSLYNNTIGNCNTAVGQTALKQNTEGSYNTALGTFSLSDNTEGDYNTSIGYNSLGTISSGSHNTAIGNDALSNNEGNNNTAIGSEAGQFNASGNNNVFIGYKAGNQEYESNKLYIENSDSETPLIYGEFDNDYIRINGSLRVVETFYDSNNEAGATGEFLSTTGSSTDWIQPTISHLADGKAYNYSTFLGEDAGSADDGTYNQNTALGYQAMKSNNSGMGNTAEGYRALYTNTSGDYNTAIGNEALLSNSNGTQNTALGNQALASNSSGNYNIAIGSLSLFSNLGGGQNNALGNGTLYNNTTGSLNTVIGDNAMVSNTSGGSNSALGENALNGNQTGSFNVALGAKAGYGATGNLNVFLGNQAGYSETGDNKLYIENSNSVTPLIWGDFSTDEVRINGNLTISNQLRDSGGFAAANGELLFGTGTGTTWRFAAINDLSNGITDENSTYLGNGAGVSDDLTNNKNTGLGHQALNANINGEYNAASGHQALFSNISGSYNTANGHQALYSNTGSYNTANGSLSLYNNTTGSFNTALGFGALSYNQGNWGSVAIGYNAMYNANNSTSTNYTYNTALGFEALKGSGTPSNNTGQSNTSVGYQTLFSNSSGGLNTAVGTGALYSNTLGSSNTALGNGALYSNKANSGSTAIGHNAMFYAYDNTSGWVTCNTAVGFEALRGSTSPASNTGHSNTTVGHKSLFSNTSGDFNTGMGREALYNNTSGNNNTVMGYQAGYLSNGSGNLFLGHTAGYYESGNNKLYIDNTNTSSPLIYGDFGSNQLKINGEFQVSASLRDSGGDSGINGQVLSSTGSGTNWINFPPGDNLGNHYATQDIVMASTEIALNGGYISGDGDDEGLTVNSSGMVGIGTPNPSKLFEVYGYSSGGSGHFTNTATTDYYGVYGQCSGTDYYGYGGYFKGGFQGVHGVVTPTGSSTYYGVFGEVSGGSGNNYGVYGTASGSGTNYAGYFSGNVHVTGTLSKGSGSFKIDHPLEPDNKYLSHSFVESPDMMNVYNGNIITDENGLATVELPEWFETLNRDFRYQLTVIGEFAQAIVFEKIKENSFSIKTDKPEIEVSWQVTGIRQDKYANAHRIPVEEDKNENEIGKYLHPELFGKSKELSIGYVANKKKISDHNKIDNLSK